jgi:hypothetical protein
MAHDPDANGNHQHKRRSNWVFIGFLAIAGYFLITEHRAHLFSYWPFLIFLACPLMHLFHHGGHGSHGSGQKEATGDQQKDKPTDHQSHTTNGES